ncbi:non-ribosomal peptide synthetase [Paenibacillus sp. GSMTC-2017]|uniref:non-ribosomal peptide synthetase n=1 Tax=Paenibacillus sp. GSMTC-2017 TaxID=2794350 RepID=UPI0018D76A91|nr:non-ribosomal peptide synthetase [Paenibacillus sp. GSMTC-2017]MBH5320086.1 non-ribosomal peptide synthetase [Paenibacillus sp. GSMTC-2017]
MTNILDFLKTQFSSKKDKVAISETNRSITFGGLNALSNQYYNHLREAGVSPGEVVAIELERSIEAIASMIAILKAGAAYTVINKDYPESRKQYMRETLSIQVTIDQILEPDASLEEVWQVEERTPEHLCYVIFTSGTTSLPKAVGIPDRGIIRLLGEERLGFSADKTISHISPLEFDASIIEIWGGLMNGMTVALLSKTETLNIYLVEKRIKQEIDMMWITSSLFNFWVDKKPEMFQKLSHIIIGGEQLSLHHVRQVLPYTKVINGYGPTENSVFTTIDVMEGEVDEIAIGKAFYGTELFIVDDKGELSTEGELYATGMGVGLGYIGNEEKTRESFINWNGKKVYKTGDLVRIRDDGRIVYLGRKDTQVKINGYRIDLQEVEYAAKSLGVKNAHAFVQDKKIYLAVTSRLDNLSNKLKKVLPMYMLPFKTVYVSELPLTNNGKTDTKTLYDHYFLPKTKRIAKIIQKYVNAEEVTDGTNLFEFAIDSIIIWEIAREINHAFGSDLSFFDIIENPTISEISSMIGDERHAAYNL